VRSCSGNEALDILGGWVLFVNRDYHYCIPYAGCKSCPGTARNSHHATLFTEYVHLGRTDCRYV
jgi:hypothetical protein